MKSIISKELREKMEGILQKLKVNDDSGEITYKGTEIYVIECLLIDDLLQLLTSSLKKQKVVKYTTHLTAKVIKEIKRYAIDNDLKDYEVMQEAIEKFLKDIK